MARDGREVWAKRVERWRESGLTAKEYAAEVGINAGTLAHWGWRLSQGNQRPRRARRGVAVNGAEASWVEIVAPDTATTAATTVDATESVMAQPPAAPPTAGWFEVVLGGGRVLRVPSDFDGAAVGRLLAVLEAR